jgi:tetratricopeptide (TPR) repeat protein
MGKPILCIGTYAEKPYHIEKIGRNVYCIEELCYCIVQNAFLLDEESFDKELFDWIAKECSLEKLSEDLRSMASKKCSMAALAGTILDYVGYNTRKEVDNTEKILRANAGMDVYTKRLARADFLMKNNRYTMAFREYEFLLHNTPDISRKLRARIEHCEGVMYARLFLFDRAQEMFAKAFDDGHDPESYIQYLAALRMKLSDKEYVAFIAENEDAYEASMELEKRMDEAQDYYSSSEDKHLLGTIGVFRSEGKMHEYYDMIGATTENLKNEYRSIVRDKMGSR